MEATCDSCGTITAVNFREKKRGREVIETYFNCEECDARYACFYTDAKVRALQKELYTSEDVDGLLAEITRRMDRLKEKYNGEEAK